VNGFIPELRTLNRRRWLLTIGIAGVSASAWATVRAVDFGIPRARTRPECLDGIPDRDYQYRSRSATVTTTSRRAVLLASAQFETDLKLSEMPQAKPGAVVPTNPGTGANPSSGGSSFDSLPPPRIFREAELPPPVEDLELTPPLVERSNYESPSRNRIAYHGRRMESDPNREPIEVERNALAQKLAAAEQKTITRLYQLDRPSLTIDQCEVSRVALQLRSDGLWILSLRADQNKRADAGAPAPYNPKLYVKRNEFNVRLHCLGAFNGAATSLSGAAGQPVLVDLDPEPFWVENGQPRYVRLTGCDRRLMARLDKIDRVELEFFYR